MKLLVTGGAGYIGSHTCIELLQNGWEIVVVDNLSNSSKESLIRIETITGKRLVFFNCDLRDKSGLEAIFNTHHIDAVIHFAGMKAVGESTEVPLLYYHNNVTGTLVLLEAMKTYGVKTIVFSSSATVYGSPRQLPIKEDFPLQVTNPYGRTKLMIEEILQDLHTSDPSWRIALLRYFNPVGAHSSGMIGEDPNGIPNNLMPYIAQVAIGKLPCLNVYGDDYDTPDGTGVRDYIHVLDLASGHIAVLPYLFEHPGVAVYNLGTGQGYSVLEMIKGFEKASGRPVPYKVTGRRQGDIAACYADPSKAKNDLGWHAHRSLENMCQDAWHWQKKNPNGYKTDLE